MHDVCRRNKTIALKFNFLGIPLGLWCNRVSTVTYKGAAAVIRNCNYPTNIDHCRLEGNRRLKEFEGLGNKVTAFSVNRELVIFKKTNNQNRKLV
jgi:hypothetical protein